MPIPESLDVVKFEEDVKEMIKKEGVLYAVKWAKEQTGWGLLESKNYVDQFR